MHIMLRTKFPLAKTCLLRSLRYFSSSVQRHTTFMVWAPDYTDGKALSRRMAVRPKHLVTANKLIEQGILSEYLINHAIFDLAPMYTPRGCRWSRRSRGRGCRFWQQKVFWLCATVRSGESRGCSEFNRARRVLDGERRESRSLMESLHWSASSPPLPPEVGQG